MVTEQHANPIASHPSAHVGIVAGIRGTFQYLHMPPRPARVETKGRNSRAPWLWLCCLLRVIVHVHQPVVVVQRQRFPAAD